MASPTDSCSSDSDSSLQSRESTVTRNKKKKVKNNKSSRESSKKQVTTPTDTDNSGSESSLQSHGSTGQKNRKKKANKKSKKCAKAPQITNFEKNLLLEIISKESYKKIVENKSTNQVWTSQKEEAWDKISHDFCSNLAVHKRSGKQLKTVWENLKCRAKKQVTKVKKSRSKTGGGVGRKDVSPLSNRVISIVPNQMVPMQNAFDDDATSSEETESTLTKIVSQLANSAGKSQVTDRKEEECLKSIDPDSIRPSKSKPPPPKRKLIAGQEIIIRLEEELQGKKLKLLDVQIAGEQRKNELYEEFHKARMLLLRKQLDRLNVPVFDESEVQSLLD